MRVLFLRLNASLSLAQPYLNYRGIVIAPGTRAPGLPSGSLARGGMIAIFGRNLGPSARAQACTLPRRELRRRQWRIVGHHFMFSTAQ